VKIAHVDAYATDVLPISQRRDKFQCKLLVEEDTFNTRSLLKPFNVRNTSQLESPLCQHRLDRRSRAVVRARNAITLRNICT
jgi:hypothetical protein